MFLQIHVYLFWCLVHVGGAGAVTPVCLFCVSCIRVVFFCIVFHVFLCRVSCNHVSCIFFGACRGSRCSRGCVSYLCVFVYLFLYHVLCICVTFLVHAGAGVASRGCVSFFVCIPIYFVSCMVYSCIFFFGACGSRCS